MTNSLTISEMKAIQASSAISATAKKLNTTFAFSIGPACNLSDLENYCSKLLNTPISATQSTIP